MQTNTWTEFVNRVANTVGDGPLVSIHAETSVIAAEKDENGGDLAVPTFLAKGD